MANMKDCDYDKTFFVGKSMKSEHESNFFPHRIFIVYFKKYSRSNLIL